MANTLYGSSATKEGIIRVICDFWYRKDVTLVRVENAKQEIYSIQLGDCLAEGWQVTKKGSRYRFEEVE